MITANEYREMAEAILKAYPKKLSVPAAYNRAHLTKYLWSERLELKAAGRDPVAKFRKELAKEKLKGCKC
jgi:hypothetical protein